MPRRGHEVVQLPMSPRKKAKTIDLPPTPSTPSLDVSFSDDEALPPGIIFTDIQQKKWRIGKPIGMFISYSNSFIVNQHQLLYKPLQYFCRDIAIMIIVLKSKIIDYSLFIFKKLLCHQFSVFTSILNRPLSHGNNNGIYAVIMR